MTNVNCLVIRRSTNTNSFGLRGIWVICEHSRRVFSFAANDLDAAAYQVGEFVPVPFIGSHGPERPCHELCELQGTVKAADVPKFLNTINRSGELADKWNTYRQAKAIVGVPATAPTTYTSFVAHEDGTTTTRTIKAARPITIDDLAALQAGNTA